MRHWRNALQQIYEHHATKAIPGYGPQSDTEKALVDALKELELQCKERLDLLEALRASRHEESKPDLPPKHTKSTESFDSSSRAKGSIGQGTIPAVTYSELSRPTPPPRPPLPVRSAPDLPGATGSSRSSDNLVHTTSNSTIPSPNLLPKPEKQTRSVSPEKHTMRTTLRSSKIGMGDKVSGSNRKSPKPAAEGPSKAATLAWSALSSREKANSRGLAADAAPSPAYSSSRQAAEHMLKTRYSQNQWDNHSRRLVPPRDGDTTPNGTKPGPARHSDEYPFSRPSNLSVSAASAASNALNVTNSADSHTADQPSYRSERLVGPRAPVPRFTRDDPSHSSGTADESGEPSERRGANDTPARRRAVAKRPGIASPLKKQEQEQPNRARRRERPKQRATSTSSLSAEETRGKSTRSQDMPRRTTKSKEAPGRSKQSKRQEEPVTVDSADNSSEASDADTSVDAAWKKKKESILKDLPPGVDESAAKQILNDIIVQGDEVRWGDIAGLEIAKNALRETVVYPFLRPDLFMGLREPARGMLLFGPPGTGKTMLARAVATESRSTFFSISASSLTSKYLGESEKLVRALFGLARTLAPSIIFVDEIDSLLSQRSGSGEHEATRRIKTEFLIQWSDLQRAAAGRETTERDRERGDANRVLVLAATNLPWAIDEAARRRFVRRQYIPLPEPATRETQLRTLLGQQKHSLSNPDIVKLVDLTDGKYHSTEFPKWVVLVVLTFLNRFFRI